MAITAKLLHTGGGQAVCLPAEFRFPGQEVYIRRAPATGDVILSRRPGSWDDFFKLVAQAPEAHDFLAERGDSAPRDRPPL